MLLVLDLDVYLYVYHFITFQVVLLTVLWILENCSPYLKYKYPGGYEPEKDPLLKKEKDYTFVNYDCDK